MAEVATFEARVAITLCERWGMVAAKPFGEDAAGRSKAELLSPQETVDRACQTAECLATELRQRGWLKAFQEKG